MERRPAIAPRSFYRRCPIYAYPMQIKLVDKSGDKTNKMAIRDSVAETWRKLWPHGASWSVSLIPTMVLFANGKPVKTWYGAIPLHQLIADLGAWL